MYILACRILTTFFVVAVESIYAVLLQVPQLQELKAETGLSPRQPQSASHTDYQLFNSESLGGIQQQSPQSASLSPPPCKVQSLSHSFYKVYFN